MQKGLAKFPYFVQKLIMKLSNLQELGAAELGMKLSEVKTRVRFVREGGFFQSGPRGPGSPEMKAMDLSAFMLAMVSFVEPTAAKEGLTEMLRADLRGCEWFLPSAAFESFADPEDRHRKCLWSHAPLTPIFGDQSDRPNVLRCLADLFSAAAKLHNVVRMESLSCETSPDGMMIKATFQEFAAPKAMRIRYVSHTGDKSDGWYFPDSDNPVWWKITIKYQIDESQRDRRRHLIEIPGDNISRLIRTVLGDG